MTDERQAELYPQYCFHLSPTINRWCHIRIADILALTSHPGFLGQDIYFHLNHPIKWVRIAGVIIAVDEREGKHIYTVDDSSGAIIECVVVVAPRLGPGTTARKGTTTSNAKDAQPLPVVDAPIDIGHTIDIKGSLSTWWKKRQIRAEKIVHLHSTEQEVLFWEKVTLLRREVLSKPWMLGRREVRRCRREYEGSHSRRLTKARDSFKTDQGRIDTAKADLGRSKAQGSHEGKALPRSYSRETGLERKATKRVMGLMPVAARNKTLGL